MNLREPSLDMIDVIHQRSSVRSYTGQPLDRNTIGSLLAAAVRAPTAIHAEPWEFVVVQDKGLLERISDLGKRFFMDEIHSAQVDRGGLALERFVSPEFNIFYNAGTLIVICGNASKPFVVADCWLAAENLLLAACAMGLGGCVIGCAVMALNTLQMKAELAIPADSTAIAPVIVGVPDGLPTPTQRKQPLVLAWR